MAYQQLLLSSNSQTPGTITGYCRETDSNLLRIVGNFIGAQGFDI